MKVKQKTHKGAAKRFKITATGKILHRSQKIRHLRNVKGKRKVRSLKSMKIVTGTIEKKLKKLLAIR